jgi:chromosome segregation ATPase
MADKGRSKTEEMKKLEEEKAEWQEKAEQLGRELEEAKKKLEQEEASCSTKQKELYTAQGELLSLKNEREAEEACMAETFGLLRQAIGARDKWRTEAASAQKMYDRAEEILVKAGKELDSRQSTIEEMQLIQDSLLRCLMYLGMDLTGIVDLPPPPLPR